MEVDIEGMFFQLQRWKRSVADEASSCKERTYYRARITAVEAKIRVVITRYNQLQALAQTNKTVLDPEAVLDGDHPWTYPEEGGRPGKVSVYSNYMGCVSRPCVLRTSLVPCSVVVSSPSIWPLHIVLELCAISGPFEKKNISLPQAASSTVLTLTGIALQEG